jgi:hypothetical protein
MKKAARNDPSGPRKEKTYTAPRYPANGEATGLAASRSCTGRGVQAPVLGNAEPFLAHPLVELAIMGVFSRAGSCRIVFGFGDGLLDFWGFAKAGGRDKRHVPPRQSASRRHGKPLSRRPVGARMSPSSGAYSV